MLPVHRLRFFIPLLVTLTQGLEVVFENVEQLSGFDVYDSTLRVRKFNRTTVTLNGTITVKIPVNNSFASSTEVYHSSLGNQQWNHYPMKLQSKSTCDFLYSLYDDYYEHIKDLVNLPEKGECPIMPRQVHIIDKVFPSKAIPAVMPKGLWKAITTTSLGDVERARFELTVKAYSDTFY